MPVDSRAQIHDKARVDSSAKIGAWVNVSEEVVIGANVSIAPFVSIIGKTEIGAGCEILSFTTLGSKPEHIGDQGDGSRLVIGENSIIREHVTINRGTKKGGGITMIGKGCYIMNKSHIAHDCYIGDDAILGAYCGLSGHTYIGARTVLLGKCATQPFIKIGCDSYVIAGSDLRFDVPPMVVATQHCLRGINIRGLLMRGAKSDDIAILKKFYKRLEEKKGALDKRTQGIKAEFKGCIDVEKICEFVSEKHRYPWLTPYPEISKSRYINEQTAT